MTAGFPTLEEVRAAIPPAGIEIKALVGLFKPRVGQRISEFIALVKSAGVQDKSARTRLLPKPQRSEGDAPFDIANFEEALHRLYGGMVDFAADAYWLEDLHYAPP